MTRGAALLVSCAFVLGLSSAIACGDNGAVTLAPAAGDADVLRPRHAGERCDDGTRCRVGLVCASGTCQPSHAADENAPCVISSECKDGLYCSPDHKCANRGSALEGDSCSSEVDCTSGFRCNAIGLSAECQREGSGDQDAPCATSAACFGGLLCRSGTCAPYAPSTVAPPVAAVTWKGVACADDPGPARAYFQVPRGTPLADFFRLPFPNDARRPNGALDLTGFPSPGTEALGYDFVDRWRLWLQGASDGFSSYPTVVFRFSTAIDLESIKAKTALRFVDLTADADVSFSWSTAADASPYVCANSLRFRPVTGAPLASGHVFAAFVVGAKAIGDAPVVVDDDMKAVLAGADPGGPLSGAWNAYAPLRTWAASKALDLSTISVATVFTVGRHDALVKQTAAAVTTGTVRSATDATGWRLCGASPSPCPDTTGARACGADDPSFFELHKLVTLPVFQKGKAPYLTPDDGGDVVLDASGAALAQSTEDVCVALTVPKFAAPASGFPVVVYAADTNGSFRSAINDGIAARFANADGTAHVATLTIDPVAHGPRRGGSSVHPASLWFGTGNPGAWRGRNVQAAADLVRLVGLFDGFDIPANVSPTSAEVKLGEVLLMGVGQGATAVALAAPRTNVPAVILAGMGASFLDNVPSRRRPVDFADVAPTIAGEPILTSTDPMLGLLQNAVDVVDPLVHASTLVTSAPRSVLMIYGQGDSYTASENQRAYAIAAGLGVAAPPTTVTSPDIINLPILPVPAGGNVGGTNTAIVRQYAASGYDGHLAVFRDPDAIRDVDRFVTDVAAGKTPKVGR